MFLGKMDMYFSGNWSKNMLISLFFHHSCESGPTPGLLRGQRCVGIPVTPGNISVCVFVCGRKERTGVIWVIAHIPPGHNSSPCCPGRESPGGVGVLSENRTAGDIMDLLAPTPVPGGKRGGSNRWRQKSYSSFFLSFFLSGPLCSEGWGESRSHHSVLSCSNTLQLSSAINFQWKGLSVERLFSFFVI